MTYAPALAAAPPPAVDVARVIATARTGRVQARVAAFCALMVLPMVGVAAVLLVFAAHRRFEECSAPEAGP